MTTAIISNPSAALDLNFVFRRFGAGIKRGPEDLIGRSNGATLVANAMTADTLAKKAKLDSSALSLGVCFPASNSLISVPTLHHLSPSTTAALMSLSTPTQFPTSQSINGLMPAPHMASTSSNNSADIQIPVSRVIHLRNIPSDMTELELVHFCMPFGKLVNYLMLKGKNQAFVEYEDDAGAQTLVSVSNACPMAIRGRTIFCQYSTHQELKTERKGPTKNGSIFGDMGVAVGDS